MDHANDWKLHDFPFTFYNAENILYNYNTVPFLTTVSKHNIGLFQRLCGCFQQVPWGGLTARILQHFQQTSPSPEDMFKFFGLDNEMVLSRLFFSFLFQSPFQILLIERNWILGKPTTKPKIGLWVIRLHFFLKSR